MPQEIKTIEGLGVDFGHDTPLIVFDGICNLCSRSMQIVFKYEKQPIYFLPVQSALGHSVLMRYGLNPDDPASFLFLNNGKAWQSSSAVFSLAKLLRGWPQLLLIFWLIPRPITNIVYSIFACNRYKWFGKSDTCMIPSPEMKLRIVSRV